MQTPHILHPLDQYAAALNAAGLLVDAPTLPDTPIDCVSYDSRGLHGRALFICKGAHFKEEYLTEAIRRGAVAYVSERKYSASIPCLRVNDVRHALVVLGRLYYNNIIDRLTTIGITGTKGKTTTAFFVRAILNDELRRDGKSDCAMLSSSRVYDGVIDEPSHMSTPEVLELYAHFQNAADSGIGQMVMEVSSQALKYGRVRGMHFDVGCFVNLGLDHISPIEHPDFEDYYHSKLMIFDMCRAGCVNLDAERADETLRYAREHCPVVTTYGTREDAELRCLHTEKRADGIYFAVRSPWYNGEFSITMPGLFNVSNALSAMAVCAQLGVPEEHVRAGLRRARAEGRMQVYESRDGEVAVIVDYAHNRLSFDALFRSLRLEWPGRRVISVFGCPGGKALQRRRDMGELGGQYSDYVYITEDDPGEEPLEGICAEIEQYVACPHEVLPDREESIRRAILEPTGRRLVVLAAKGEDKYMKRGTNYDDYEGDAALAQKYLAEYEEAHA